MDSITQLSWKIIDSGVQGAHVNMDTDRLYLNAMTKGQIKIPQLRFFQWEKPVVSFGYLLDPEKVKDWAKEQGGYNILKRPTGGGAVLHQTTDLSFSLLWPRRRGILPDKPRDCYEIIHVRVKEALETLKKGNPLSLFSKTSGNCETTDSSEPSGRFSDCFQEPVCNDLMRGVKKIVGGALRLTHRAILYQGNLIWDGQTNIDELKNKISANFNKPFQNLTTAAATLKQSI